MVESFVVDESHGGVSNFIDDVSVSRRKPPLLRNKIIIYEKCKLGELFGDNDLSLLALNMYNDGYGFHYPVFYASFRYENQKWCVVETDQDYYTSVNNKVFREKLSEMDINYCWHDVFIMLILS